MIALPLGLSAITCGLVALALAIPSADNATTAAPGTSAEQPPAAAPRPGDAEPSPPADEQPASEDGPVLLRWLVEEVDTAEGELEVVPGESQVYGDGPLRRFIVEVEAGLPGDAEDFATAVEEVLGDPRSWGGAGDISFQRVDSEPADFRVVLAAPDTTDRLCAPLTTNGYLSCHNNGRAVINQNRWVSGVDSFDGDMETYRTYVINHEVGHALGHGHVTCPGEGEPAPVMQQQSIRLDGCEPNGWVHP